VFALSLILTGCGWGEAKSESDRQSAFTEVIGFDAPAGVTKIESSYYWMRDAYACWLRFECDDSTLERVRKLATNKTPESERNFSGPSHAEHNPNAPDWWKHGPDPTGFEEFSIDRTVKDSRYDKSHVYIDRRNHIVYAEREVSE